MAANARKKATPKPCAHHAEIDGLLNIDVATFIQNAVDTYMPFEQFAQLKMPGDLTVEDAWILTSFARRMKGWPRLQPSNLHAPAPASDAFWTFTSGIHKMTNHIIEHSGKSSALWTYLQKRLDSAEIKKILTSEIHAACFRDGIRLGYETVRSLVVDKQPPQQPEELLVCTVVNTYLHAIQGKEGAFRNADWLRRTHQDLMNVLPNPPTRQYRPQNTPKTFIRPTTSSSCVDELVHNSLDQAPWGSSPLFNVLINSDICWERRPFGSYNALLEMVLRASSFAAIGLPLLALVPISKMRLDWERGIAEGLDPFFEYGSAVIDGPFGVDSTPYLQQILAFYCQGIDDLENACARLLQDAHLHRKAIAADKRLNLRQHALLEALVNDPDSNVSVASYAKMFDIALSTARLDLLRLTEFRFLNTRFEGTRQVFWLDPRAFEQGASKKASRP